MASIPCRSRESWLEEAASALAQALSERVGVFILLGRWDDARQRWRLVSAAQHDAGYESLCRYGSVLSERWPDDEYSLAAGHASFPPKSSIGRLPELVPSQVWERCGYRRLRSTQGLAGAARWLGLASRHSHSEAILLQLEDPRDPAGPSDRVLEEVAALAPQLLAAYETAFLIPELRRLQAFDRLTPTQQRVAQLLLQGHSQVDIAKHLGRKYHTVRGHVKGIYERLHVHSRSEFVHALGCLALPECDEQALEAEANLSTP
ncbi:MAG: LuxR C-terminal-related transcriptional regulator [Phycisphaerales bacterium JB038]